MSDYTLTPNLNLFKPTYDADAEQWGNHLNSNADRLDTVLGATGGGPFLPLSGGTMQGQLNVTATGSTVSRSVQDRFVDVRNVRDFGAVGDNVTDDSAAIQAAVSLGGRIYLPPGNYRITTTIYVPANTHIFGVGDASHIVMDWLSGRYEMFLNVNWQAATITDANIVFEDLYLEYRSGNETAAANDKILNCYAVENVLLHNVTFRSSTSLAIQNATAFLRCHNTWTVNCRAYEMRNCSYDHWDSPRDVWVVDCYAESADAAQFVNFNPEPIGGGVTGRTADGFTMTGCTLVATGPNSVANQIEPIADGNAVKNVRIANNLFRNSNLPCRRNTRGVTVSGNVFDNPGGSWVFGAYPIASDTPDAISFIGNTIIDPGTVGANYGAIFVDGTNSIVSDNTLSGSNPYACVHVGNTARVQAAGNAFPATSLGVTGTPAPFQMGASLTLPGGLTLTGGNWLTLNTPTPAGRSILYQTGGSTRWELYASAAAESGGNAGSDFIVGRYSDAGAYLGNALTISRQTGAITFGSVLSGTVTVNNGSPLRLLDASGGPMDSFIQADNNWIFRGTGSTGAARNIASMMQRSDTSPLILLPPVQFNGSAWMSNGAGFNDHQPIAKPTVTGAKGSNAALASLLTALAAYGLVTDSTSA